MQTPYIVTVSSEKGGVGKTTLATNLAIYLKALHEDLPVTLFSFDNHFSVDRMFRIGKGRSSVDVRGLFQGVPAEQLVETGEYGVQFIASSEHLNQLRRDLEDPSVLAGARYLLSGGEALSPQHVQKALEALPHLTITNAYGPTECGTIATSHRVERDRHWPSVGSIPIGRPLPHTG